MGVEVKDENVEVSSHECRSPSHGCRSHVKNIGAQTGFEAMKTRPALFGHE